MRKDNPLLYKHLKTDPSPLNDLATANRIYEAVSAAVSLELFKYLTTGKTPAELADELSLDPQIVLPLLKALVEAGTLRENNGKFFTAPLADTYLRKGSTLYLGQEFVAGSFGRQLIALLNFNTEGFCGQTPLDKERLRQIGVVGLMGSIQNTVEGCDLSGCKNLLDLGGGHGFFSIAFAQKYPLLKVTLFDLPEIVPLAQEFVRQFALENRINCIGGDFLQDNIGQDYDAVLCSNVLHANARDILLAKVYQALNNGGQLIVKTRIGDAPDNIANCATALFLQTKGAKEIHSAKAWQGFLENHGFREVKMTGLTGMFATITARKGAKKSAGG